MARISVSVPDDLKEEFQKTFAHENQSTLVARLMKQAIEERRRQQVRATAIDALLQLCREGQKRR
jgi:metal-responsive CopG/Arc/MetJ family transcriptional regulator